MKKLIWSVLMMLFTGVALHGSESNKEYDVYLMIGQSNMAGRGLFEESDTVGTIDGVWLLDSDGVPVKASSPLNRYSTIRKDLSLQGYGPGEVFSKTMHNRTGRKILLVVNAKGGSSILQWLPGASGGFLDEAIRRTRQALQHGTLRGILWQQGETDIQRSTEDYAGKFNAMITSLRQELGATDIPVAVGQPGRWQWESNEKIKTFIDSIMPQMCSITDNCHPVSSFRLTRRYKDKIRDPHFSRKAQMELGRRYADAIIPQIDSIYVTKYQGNRNAAISFTFDDGDEEHASLVAPELEKRGFRGTFWIIGRTTDSGDPERPRASWSQLRKMAENGHEISNHSWSHGKLVLMTPQEISREIAMNDSAIEHNVGVRPVTFCYPFNATTPILEKLASANRVGTRLHQFATGQQNNKATPEKLQGWIEDIIAAGDWGVTMGHGINVGYDKWYDPQVLWDMFDYVKSKEKDIWVATFRDVAAYREQRDHTHIASFRDKGCITLRMECNLDETLFNVPLTVAVKGDWDSAKPRAIITSGEIDTRVEGDLLLFETIPGVYEYKIEL